MWWSNSTSPAAFPFRDACAHVLGPHLEYLLQELNTFSPDFVWSLVYAGLIGSIYLFHSPFRSHSTASVDLYARLTKVLQTWCVMVILSAHIGPTVFQEKRMMLSATVVDDSHGNSIFFFPLFIGLSGAFLYLHKLKRLFGMGVTYGASLSYVLLNSFLLTVIVTMHSAYVSRVFDPSRRTSEESWAWSVLETLLAVPSPTQSPVRALAKMWMLCFVSLAADYQYKKYRCFDPSRGIFWSELYDLTKKNPHPRTVRIHSASVDWRELEPKPHSLTPSVTLVLPSSHPASPVQRADGAPALLPSVIGSKSAAPRFELPATNSAGGQLYREVPVLQDDLLGLFSPRRTSTKPQRRRSASRLDATTHPSTPVGLNAPGWSADIGRLNASYPVAEEQLDELRQSRHPFNKPAMVPWWSTFSFSTAMQAFLGTTLSFLAFDVRAIEGFRTPKVFDLKFSGRAPAPDAGLTNSSITSRGAFSMTDSESAKGERSSAAVGESVEEEVDVWFDWIADVGDGFNPTYEMARLLAQPSLTLELKSEMGYPQSPISPQQPFTPSMSPKKFRGGDEDSRPRGRHSGVDEQRGMGPRRTASVENIPRLGASFRRGRRSHKNQITMPRGSFTIIGGDLAYPNPTDETYQTRLFSPYCDALRGNVQLQQQFHEHQRRIVQQDPEDPDVAHLRMLDASTVSRLAHGGDLLRSQRLSVDEALRSVPLMFAIPGNHDWFDGLSTFRKYIVEKTWIGGWLMPQRSSFFVLKLPLNWFIICCDTGNTADIDSAQRNYFLDVVEKYMDEQSCVILTCHEPGWVYDAMMFRTEPLQPEIDRLIRHLGTRLRLRIAGDIHHYSRHTPCDPLSEAATLVVSGGGGAFLHGPRGDLVISQGTRYKRGGAFPQGSHTFLPMVAKLWGFRLVNWKFDVVVGCLCFALVLSLLPLPLHKMIQQSEEVGHDLSYSAQMISFVVGTTMDLFSFLLLRATVSLVPFGIFLVFFSSAGSDRQAPLWWRAIYGGFWTCVVTITSCFFISVLHWCLVSITARDLVATTVAADGSHQWRSLMEDQMRALVDAGLNYTRDRLGSDSVVSTWMASAQHSMYDGMVVRSVGFVLRCMDPVETLLHLSLQVDGWQVGRLAESTNRIEVLCYYFHLLLFYWISVTPVVSTIIGVYLFLSVTIFDYMYDGTYSAFQIEDFKSFVRFKIDRHTRDLHGYVVSEKKVPKVWELNTSHVVELEGREGTKAQPPPHLSRHPSRWRMSRRGEDTHAPELLETFVVRPHRGAGRG